MALMNALPSRPAPDCLPDLAHENRLRARTGGPVAGVDEAGRGPWAGPVVAAAVILPPAGIPDGLQDSKKLTSAARDRLFNALRQCAQIGVGIADVARIDEMNILGASLWAMQTAVAQLARPPAAVLVDGNRAPQLPCLSECVIKGDSKCLSIAAASIIAKVTRDRIMLQLAEQHPGYGWERNKGYGTRQHAEALQRLGVTPHHRRSFKPVQRTLGHPPNTRSVAK